MSIFDWFRRWKGPELAADIIDPVFGPLSQVSVWVWEGTNCLFNGRRIDIEIEGNSKGPYPELRQLFDQFRQEYLRYIPEIDQTFAEADLIPADEAPLIVGHIRLSNSSKSGNPFIELMHYADHPLEEHPYVATIVDGQVTDVGRG